jgi:hypothetical protein
LSTQPLPFSFKVPKKARHDLVTRPGGVQERTFGGFLRGGVRLGDFVSVW